MSDRLGCAWEVRAGLIPGEPMEEYSKNFYLTGEERRDLAKFLETKGAAEAYATRLQIECLFGRTCNWVKVEFTWL